jgi:hypothetical protein
VSPYVAPGLALPSAAAQGPLTQALPVEVGDLILRLRRNSVTPAWTPAPAPSPGTSSATTGVVTSRSTISRHLARAGLVVVALG